jgi:type I restriction enzyme S subunit
MANVGVIRYEDKGDIGNKKPDDLAKCKIVRKGNLVINSMNYGIGSYGLSPYNGVCSPVYIVLQPKPSEIETQYALRVFEEKEFQSYAQSFGNGILAHRSAIGWDDLKNISIALPPLREQTQIARFLDHETARIDALIEEQQRLIELLKEKRQAVISHAVTKGLDPNVPMKDSGVEWLGEVPEHWEVTKLGWTVSELTYGFTNPMPTEDTGPAMLTANDIGWGRIHYDQARSTSDVAYLHLLTNKSRPKKGDLLLTKDGTLGRVAVHDGTPACINQSVALIRPVFKRLLPDFLCSVLQASCYQEKMLFDAGGTTIKHIYISTLAKMNLAIPPLSEQEALISFIARESKRFDLLISTARNGIELLKERRSALISAAVTGKIDVRNWQPEQSSVADTGEDYAMVAEQSAEYR